MILPLLLGCLADIRPDAVHTFGEDAARQARGRELLEAAAEAQGGPDAWAAHQTATVTGVDDWPGLLGRIATAWPEPTVSLRLEQRLHTFDSRVHFDDGSTWGISDWQTWSIGADGEHRIHDHRDARFILPTMQYFVEFPYRILEAPVVTEVDDAVIDGTTYSRVFATWESLKPSRQYDQYVLYISQETGLLEKAHFTVREAGGMMQGTMHFADFRAVEDMLIPFQMTVTFKPEDDTEDYLHEVLLSSVVLDALDPDGFGLPE